MCIETAVCKGPHRSHHMDEGALAYTHVSPTPKGIREGFIDINARKYVFIDTFNLGHTNQIGTAR